MRVHAIQTGTVAVRERQRAGSGLGPLRLVSTLMDRRWTEPLPILAWLIEHPEGLIVVDTGETAAATTPGYFPRWHPYFRRGLREHVDPDQEIGTRLTELGFSPADVRWVVLTHLHTDHAGGLSHFPSSEILISRAEFENARGLLGRLRGFLPNRWPDWLRPRLFDLRAIPFGPFPSSLTLTEARDVTIIPTAGHTPGHVSLVLDQGDRTILFAGDASYTEQAMLDQVVDGVAPRPDHARQTLRRIRDFAGSSPTVYLPSHDPDAPQRLEAGRTVTVDPDAR